MGFGVATVTPLIAYVILLLIMIFWLIGIMLVSHRAPGTASQEAGGVPGNDGAGNASQEIKKNWIIGLRIALATCKRRLGVVFLQR